MEVQTTTTTTSAHVRPWWSVGGFGRLFFGQSVSAVGSQVTFMALPLIAVLTLGATPGAMGVLGALDNLPYLLLGLWIGVFVDRHARRRLMIASDLLRAIAVVSVPVAFVTGRLAFVQLCAVAFIVGAGNIAFDVSCQAQLPELVDPSRLVDANGALQTTTALSSMGAPGLIGLLIKVAGAPLSMLIDAASYVVSAVSIASIRQPEHPRPAADQSTLHQIAEGIRVVRADTRLVGLAGGAAMLSIGMNAAFAVLVYYLADRLGFGALRIGFVFLAFGVGGAFGAVAASRMAARWGYGRVMASGPVIGAAGLVVVVAVGDAASPWRIAALYAGAVVMGAGLLVYQVLGAGLRQSLAPERVRGRVLGTMRFVEWGSMPLGSLIGGALGEVAGAVPALLVGAAIVATCTGWTLATPLRGLREIPEAA